MIDRSQYDALRGAAALVESPTRARLRVTGKNRLDLLHRMTSQELKSLQPGEGRTAVLLSDKGRVVDHFAVFALEDELRILSGREEAAPSLDHLKRYKLRDDFQPEDQSGTTALLRVLGPRAAEALEAAGVDGAGERSTAPPLFIRRLPEAGEFLLATDGPCASNFALWVPAGRAAEWRRRLLERGGAVGLRQAGPEAYEAVRIESGLPAHGAELSEEVNPLEAGLAASIHWNKGCYIGQEVIARLDTYHKVQRHLVGVRLPAGSAPPPAGTELTVAGEPVGAITSATLSPGLGVPIALAYVRTKHAAEGTEVTLRDPRSAVPGGGEPAAGTPLTARIVSLPFAP